MLFVLDRRAVGNTIFSFAVAFTICPSVLAEDTALLGDNNLSTGSYAQFDMVSLKRYQDLDSDDTAGGVKISDIASTATSGDYGHGNSPESVRSRARSTSSQSQSLFPAQTVPLDKVFGGRRLPPTRLDSFVRNSAGAADLIYGDEGSVGIPPFFGFDQSHRIEFGVHSGGLTTGHRSALPEAWGYPQ